MLLVICIGLTIDFTKQVEKWCARLPWRKISSASKIKPDTADRKVSLYIINAVHWQQYLI